MTTAEAQLLQFGDRVRDMMERRGKVVAVGQRTVLVRLLNMPARRRFMRYYFKQLERDVVRTAAPKKVAVADFPTYLATTDKQYFKIVAVYGDLLQLRVTSSTYYYYNRRTRQLLDAEQRVLPLRVANTSLYT